jgi:hypothetical protein
MRFIAIAVSLILPVQAFALSCIAPSVELSYAKAASSEESYLIGKGKLIFYQSLMPRSTVSVDRPVEITRIPARVTGKAFDGTGFDQAFGVEVEMVVRCIQTWCPVITRDKEHLVFLRETETNYQLAIDPCGGTAFPEPTPEMVDQVLTCFKDKSCSADPS